MGEELKAVLERREQMAPDTYRVGLAHGYYPARGDQARFRGTHRALDGDHRPLEATAVAIDDGGTPFLLLCADWLGSTTGADDARRLREAIGLAEERFVLCGSHTHCGPCIREKDELRFGPLTATTWSVPSV